MLLSIVVVVVRIEPSFIVETSVMWNTEDVQAKSWCGLQPVIFAADAGTP